MHGSETSVGDGIDETPSAGHGQKREEGGAVEEGGTGRAGALRDFATCGGGWLARPRVEKANRQVDAKKSPS